MKKCAMPMRGFPSLIVAIMSFFWLGSIAYAQSGITGPSQINRCDQQPYTITVTNDSVNPACNLVVTSTLPSPGFTYVNGTSTIDIGCGSNEPTISGGDTLTWDIDSLCGNTQLDPNESFTITYDVSTDCSAVSGSDNVQIDYTDCPTGGAYNDFDALSITVLPGAVTINKTPNVIPQEVGQEVTWTLTVENSGLGVIENVEVTDVLGAGLAFVSATQNGNNSGQTTTWTSNEYASLASMNPGDILTMDITAQVISCENLDNTADVRFGCDPSPANTCFDTTSDGGTATSSVQRIVLSPNISFTPPDINFTYCGDTETVSFTITNIGDGSAYDVYTIVDFTGFTVSNISSGAIYNVAQTRFELADPLAASGDPGDSYNLSFDLTYTGWCGGGFPAGDLLWQKLYKDACDQEFYPPVELSTINTPAATGELTVSKTGGPVEIEIGDTITYTITSAYSGPISCGSPSGSPGPVTVVDTLPDGFMVTDAGGGTWVPGSGGTGGTITWTYLPPASLNTTITVQSPDTSQCETFCNSVFNNSITASGTDCCGCALNANDSQTTAIECAEGVTSEKSSTSPTERCADTTYTNDYTFDGGSGVVLSDLIFTEEANLEQLYNGNLSITLTGSGDITGSAAVTDTTPGPGGTLLLDFSGAAATPLAGQTLTIIYDLTATEDTIAACGGTSFYSWSSLDMGTSGSECLADGVIHETTEVNVGSPTMSLAIDGLGQIFSTCETKTITQTLTQTSDFDPKDVRLVLSGLNYYVVNPAATICGGVVAPASCTPTIDGSGDYVWTFDDAFAGSGQSATLQLDVQKRCSGTGDLVATAYFDDLCNDDATADDICSTVATETPALLLSADLLIEKTPETYYADTNTVQWEIYVTNRGTGTAYNVWVDDVLGSGLLYEHGVNPVTVDNMTGVTINDSLDHNGGAINGASVEIATMAAGERRQITFIARQIDCNNLTNDVTANWGCIGVNCQTDVTDSSQVEIPAPNLVNTNTAIPTGIRACESLDGFITLRNAGQTTTYNHRVTETLPAGLNYVPGSTRWRVNGGGWNGPDAAYDPNPVVSPLVWTSTEIPGLASAAPGDTIEIEFDMSADCPFTGGDITVVTQYENPCADVFNTATSTFSVTFNAPAITIDKTRTNEPIGCNEAIQWTITVTNNSGYTLPVIWVEDTMDAAFTYDSSVGDPPYTSDNGTNVGQLVTWELRNVNHNDTVTLTLNATTDGPPNCSPDLDNTVIAYWGCGAADGSSATKPGEDVPDNSLCLGAMGTSDVRTETREPNLAYLSIAFSPGSIDACNDSTQLTMVIENNGPTDASSIDLAITLPTGVTYNAGTAELGLGPDQASATAAIGAIGDPAVSGSTVTFYDFNDQGNNLAATIQADGGNDTLVLRFAVQSACYVTDDVDFDLRFYDCCDDTQYTVTSSETLVAIYPDLSVTKTANFDQIACGGNVEFTIQVTNNGTGNAEVVRVVDTLGDWLDYAGNFTEDQPGTVTPALIGGDPQVVGWEFNDLGAGATATFTGEATLNPDGLPNQDDCTAALRQNTVSTQWACGTSSDAIDDDPNTSGYDCTDSGSATAGPVTMEMPNLEVTSITPQINCAADGSVSGSISVRVTNTGDGVTSGAFTVEVTDGKGWTGTGTHNGAIAAGGFADVTINTGSWTPACNCEVPYSFNATVDLNNDVCECDEDDNTTTSATSYAPPIPELTITDIDFSNVSCTSDGISGNVRVQVENTGCGAATNFQVALSTDGCLIFTPQTVANLAANASTWLTFNVSGTWSDCADGSCDFTATVDQPNTVCECDGTNNSRTETYNSTLPDLVVTDIDFTNITCTNDGYAGSVDVTVRNQGPGVAVNVPVGLGTDGCLTFPGTQTIVSLASGASATVSFPISDVWADCTDGSCDFTATVDPSDSICECDGSNNTRSETHNNTLPDLAVNSVTPLGTCSADGSVSGSVTVNVSNTGFSDVTGAVVQLVSTCGIVFANQTVDLAAGASTDLTFNYTPTAAACNCTFIATIDPANAVCECTNSNNTVVSSSYETQIPDLTVSSDTLAATCSTDGQVNVAGTLTVANNGCGANMTSDIPVELTLYDNTGCTGNVVGTWSTTLSSVDIASGGGTQTFTLPDQILTSDLVTNSTGCQFSIGVELDHTNTICEFDGSNNTYCADNKSVDIPDLRGQSDTLGATCSTDGSISVAGTLTVANDGCGSNLTSDIPVRLTLYDNTGGTGTPLDQWTETLSAVNIAAGGGTQSFTLTPRTVVTDLVSNSTGCQFSIRVEYDYSGTICESNAANNSYVADNKAVDIPDLSVSTDTLTVTCLDDGQARVSGTVTLVNDGCGSNLTDDVSLRLTLFGDAGCSGAQVDQWTETVTSLNIPAGGGTQTFSLSNRDITTDLCGVSTNNAMSVRVEADEPNTICESDGTDNTRCADKTVAVPDLTVTSVATTVTCQTDGTVSGTNVSVANTGCGDAVGSVVRLTSDCGLTFADQTIDLPEGATADVFFPFTSSFTDCNCNFSAEIDPDDAICETDNTNNSGSSTDVLSVPDIEVQGQDLHLECMGDGSYQIDGTVTLVNNGCGPNLTGNVGMRFTLAAGEDCGGAALTNWTQTLTGVDLPSAGGTQTFRVQAHDFDGDLCSQSSNCVYSIQVEADYDNRICEWEGTDNDLCGADIPVEIPDLMIIDIEPNAVCSDASALVTIKNNGCSASPAGISIQISGDTSGTAGLDAIPPGGTASVAVGFGELECGTYTISAGVDPENALCECEGKNNNMTTSFTVGCPTVMIENPGEVCHNEFSTLTARISGGLTPIAFNWIGKGTFEPISGSGRETVQTSWKPPSGVTGQVPISVAIVDAAGCSTQGEITVDVKDCSGATEARPAGTCCLDMQIEHVVSSQNPDIIPVEGPIWLDTFNAMLAAAEFAGLDDNLSGWLRTEGIDPDREGLISRGYLRMADKAGLFAAFNVGNITMQSGLGLGMEVAPDVRAAAIGKGIAAEEELKTILNALAVKSGVKQLPAMRPLVLEFAGGVPIYSHKAKRDNLSWDRSQMDKTLIPLVWGTTLAAQAQLLPRYITSDDAMKQFAGRVMAWQMAQKVKLIRDRFVQTSDEGNLYVAHAYQVDQSSDNVNVSVKTDGVRLSDQAAMLWGLSRMRASYSQAKLDPPRELDTLIGIIWKTLEGLFNHAEGVYADQGRVLPYDIMLISLGLTSLVDDNPDLPMAGEAGKRLSDCTAFMAEKLVAADGGVSAGYNLEKKQPMKGTKTLADQAAVLRALSVHRDGLSAAGRIHAFMEKVLWDAEQGLYRDRMNWPMTGTYTPQGVGAAVGGIGHLVMRSDPGQRTQMLDHLGLFFEAVVTRSELQQRGSRGLPFDGSHGLITGRGDIDNLRRPIPVPSRRYRDNIIETGLGREPAPVLVSQVELSFIPLEAEKLQALKDSIDFRVERFGPRQPLFLEPIRLPKIGPYRAFETAGGMLSAGELMMAVPILAKEGHITDDAFFTDPSMAGHMATILSETARGSLVRLTMQSGNGIPLKFSAPVAQMAAAAKTSPAEALHAWFKKVAEQNGLSTVPKALAPVFVEFAGGRPDYPEGLSQGWDVRGSNQLVSLAGLAQTLKVQLQFLETATIGHHPTDPALDGFLSQVTGMVVAAKLAFIEQALEKAQAADLKELPSHFTLVRDSAGKVLDLKFSNPSGSVVAGSAPAGSSGLARISMLEALGRFISLSASASRLVPDYAILRDQAMRLLSNVWDAIRTQYMTTSDRITGLSLADAGLMAKAIGKIIQTVADDYSPKPQMRAVLEDLADFMVKGEAGDQPTEALEGPASRESLADKAAVIMGLLKAGETLNRPELVQTAWDRFNAFDKQYWSKRIQVYLPEEQHEHQKLVRTTRYRYSSEDIGLTIGVLTRLMPIAEPARKSELAERLSAFVLHLVEGARQDVTSQILSKRDVDHIRPVEVYLTDREQTYPGDILTFKITVENRFGKDPGCGDLEDFKVRNILPAGLIYLPDSARLEDRPIKTHINGRSLTWTLGDVAMGDTVTLTFRARVDKTMRDRIHRNRAESGGYCFRPVDGGDTALCGIADDDQVAFGAVNRIKGSVYLNSRGDGNRAPGDKGIAGIRIILDENRATDTDSSGTFTFDKLLPGIYQVQIDLASLPEDLFPTSDTVKTVVLGAGKTYILDFGLIRYQRIKGLVFNDLNGNGLQDDDESGVAAVGLRVKGTDHMAFSSDNGTFRIDQVPQSIEAHVVVAEKQPYLKQATGKMNLRVK